MNELTSPGNDLNIYFHARLNDHVEISISGSDVAQVSAALLHFGLGVANAAPAPMPAEPADGSLDPTPTPLSEKAIKKARAKKEAAAEPVEKPQDAAPIETQDTPAAAPSEAAPAPATAAETVAPSATPEEAAAAVKAYGAKHGIDAARSLLQSFGFARTGDITADKAGAVVEAAGV